MYIFLGINYIIIFTTEPLMKQKVIYMSFIHINYFLFHTLHQFKIRRSVYTYIHITQRNTTCVYMHTQIQINMYINILTDILIFMAYIHTYIHVGLYTFVVLCKHV